jgi:hypothetical protein
MFLHIYVVFLALTAPLECEFRSLSSQNYGTYRYLGGDFGSRNKIDNFFKFRPDIGDLVRYPKKRICQILTIVLQWLFHYFVQTSVFSAF